MAKRHLESALKVGRNVFKELERTYDASDDQPVNRVVTFRRDTSRSTHQV